MRSTFFISSRKVVPRKECLHYNLLSGSRRYYGRKTQGRIGPWLPTLAGITDLMTREIYVMMMMITGAYPAGDLIGFTYITFFYKALVSTKLKLVLRAILKEMEGTLTLSRNRALQLEN